MRTYIKKLQSKSENKRRQILAGSLTICMSLVLFVWVSSLGYKLSSDEKTAQVKEDIKPFALLGQTINETYNNITASVGNSKLFTKEAPKIEQEVKTEKIIDLIPVESE